MTLGPKKRSMTLGPKKNRAYLLADITGCSLEGRLAGLFTKTQVMAILEKLLIRWHLTSKAIVVASPFVGHQFMKNEQKMEIWEWLLALLDPNKAVFITRGAQFSSYKTLLKEIDGFDHHLLEEYGLESKLVSANTKKQDFHAKFFIGMNDEVCEVLSGSANLLKGPSIENIAFKAITPQKCEANYLNKIDVQLPKTSAPSKHHLLIRLDRENWKADMVTGSPLAG
jgi:hypothetical protein